MSNIMQESDKYNESHHEEPQRNVFVDLSCTADGVKQSIYMVFHSVMALFAIYLSWKCNNGHFDPLGFLIAIICPYLFIIYTLATKGTCDNLDA